MGQMGENPGSLLTKLYLGDNQLSDEELVAAAAYYRHFVAEIGRIEHMTSLGLEIYSIEQTANTYLPYFVEGFGRVWWNQNRDSLNTSSSNIFNRIEELLIAGDGASIQSNFEGLRNALEAIK